MRPQAASVEVISDINGDLFTLYRVVQKYLGEFVRHFKWGLIFSVFVVHNHLEGLRNQNSALATRQRIAPLEVLHDCADLIGNVHASEPGLLPLGDGVPIMRRWRWL